MAIEAGKAECNVRRLGKESATLRAPEEEAASEGMGGGGDSSVVEQGLSIQEVPGSIPSASVKIIKKQKAEGTLLRGTHRAIYTGGQNQLLPLSPLLAPPPQPQATPTSGAALLSHFPLWGQLGFFFPPDWVTIHVT